MAIAQDPEFYEEHRRAIEASRAVRRRAPDDMKIEQMRLAQMAACLECQTIGNVIYPRQFQK